MKRINNNFQSNNQFDDLNSLYNMNINRPVSTYNITKQSAFSNCYQSITPISSSSPSSSSTSTSNSISPINNDQNPNLKAMSTPISYFTYNNFSPLLYHPKSTSLSLSNLSLYPSPYYYQPHDYYLFQHHQHPQQQQQQQPLHHQCNRSNSTSFLYPKPNLSKENNFLNNKYSSSPNIRNLIISNNTILNDQEKENNMKNFEKGINSETFNSTPKRFRKKSTDVQRYYGCKYLNCGKAYGTLNHLNTHILIHNHGEKRKPNEFKELRKTLRHEKRMKMLNKSNESKIEQEISKFVLPIDPSSSFCSIINNNNSNNIIVNHNNTTTITTTSNNNNNNNKNCNTIVFNNNRSTKHDSNSALSSLRIPTLEKSQKKFNKTVEELIIKTNSNNNSSIISIESLISPKHTHIPSQTNAHHTASNLYILNNHLMENEDLKNLATTENTPNNLENLRGLNFLLQNYPSGYNSLN